MGEWGGEKSAGARRTNLSVRWSRNTVFPYKCQGHKFKKKKGMGEKNEKKKGRRRRSVRHARRAPPDESSAVNGKVYTMRAARGIRGCMNMLLGYFYFCLNMA